MKGWICHKPNELVPAEFPEPGWTEGETLLEIARVGICGTDIHAYDGTQPYFTYPRILGHELAARVIRSSDDTFQAGEEVTIIPYFHCGDCVACRQGLTNCCANLKVYGVHIDGGMRQRVSIPSKYLVKANGLNLDQLATVEPLAIGAHAIRRAGVKPGETVLVIGAGPIGIAVIQFARLAGARVIVADRDEFRLGFCKNHLGTEYTINTLFVDCLQSVNRITQNEKCSVVIDATGNLKAIESGLDYLAHGGRYVLVGLQKESFSFSHPEFHKRETTLMSSRNATREDFEMVIDSIGSGSIDPLPMITHRAPMDQLKQQFSTLLKPGNHVIKLMTDW